MEHGRILIVEDDDALRRDLTAALEEEGYLVSACANGAAAIELAFQQPFDLVVSDVRMAGMSGLDTLEQLQQHQPTVATLVITGYTAEADSIRAVRLGVGDYLKKPFRLHEFLAAVERQLQRHRLRQAREARSRALGQAAVWGLEALAGAAHSRQARRARQAGLELGLHEDAALQAQLAALTDAALASASLDPSTLPSDLRGTLDELRQEPLSDEPVSVAARLARLARGAGEAEPALQSAWERAHEQTPDTGSRRRRQFLLQLGRSHEAAGDAAAALAGFSELTRDPEPSREQVEAWLGLTRLGSGEPRLQAAARAVELAGALNPLLRAATCLEAGLRLPLGPQATEWFSAAAREARALAQPGLWARATLALAGAGALADRGELERALTRLASGEEVAEAAWWMASCLLRLEGEPLAERLLARLAREQPAALVRLMSSGRLAPAARLTLCRALSGSSHPVALDCLRGLQGDADAGVRELASRALTEGSSEPGLPVLRIRCLGGLEVERGDEPLPDKSFRSLKQRFLLARLACAERPIPTERLIDELWPDDAEGGRASLNVSVSHLRKILRPSRAARELDYVVRVGAGLQLNPELPLWHDYTELWSAPPLADDPSAETVQAWKRAVQLYRGPYLELCYLDWAVAQRDRTELLVMNLLRKLITLVPPAESIEYASRLLELDSCCQEGHLAMMRATTALGQPEAAIRQFESCRRILGRELGMEPSIALMEAHQRALLSV